MTGKTEVETVAASAPVPEVTREAEPANDGPPVEGVGLHPIFGRARAVQVLVRRIKFRAGNERSPPIPTSCGILDPAALIDSSQLLPLYGPGRYELRAIDAVGLTAHPPIQFDVPDETGEIIPYLTAPMPSHAQGGAPGAPQGGEPSQPPRPDPMVEAWREIAKQAEAGRSNDINAFVQLIEKERARVPAAGESSVMVTFLQTELSAAKGTITAREATIEKLRDENMRLRESAARSKGAGGAGGDELLNKLGGFLMEKVGGGGAPAAAGPGTGDVFRIPTGPELQQMIDAGAIPAEMIAHAVKLYKAGGLPADRWAVIEPVAAMAGLL